MSKELVAEGYAREIVELVREARQDMKIAQDRVVDIELVAGKDLRAKLQPWKDMILRDSNARDVQFGTEPAPDAYGNEAGPGEAAELLRGRAAAMEPRLETRLRGEPDALPPLRRASGTRTPGA